MPSPKRTFDVKAALTGRCPSCGAPGLFAGPVRFSDSCHHCGLNYAAFNVGDGPAAFLTLIVGAIVVALALTVELNLTPPFWVHILLWVPLTAGGVVYGLRLGKALLLHAEYHRRAGEGVLKDPDDAAPRAFGSPDDRTPRP